MILRFFLLAGTFLFASCVSIERNNPDDPGGGNYVGNQIPSSKEIPGPSVNYEGETYETVVIGTQTWFKRNLNYAVESSKCGGDDGKLKNENTSYCNTYGRLYNWTTAMALSSSCSYGDCASQVDTKHKGICPDGWHIPSNAEWMTLIGTVGISTAGTKLKSTSSWNNGNGQDTYGFAALPGGGGHSPDLLSSVGYIGNWWSASEKDDESAYLWYMNDSKDVTMNSSYKSRTLLSVRCVKD